MQTSFENNGTTDGANGSFWTPDRELVVASYPPSAFTFIGVFVSVVGLLGLLANGTVLVIFSRFKRLRSPPANTFIINLAVSDLCASGFHSMAAYSNFRGGWAFGRLGCELYAMAVGLFGLVSILTFGAIAYERCLAIACPLQGSGRLSERHFRVTRTHAKRVCCAVWLHSAVLVAMPLVGWSRYVPEGLLTSCSWDYTTRTASNRAYYVVLLVTGFVIPLSVICASYGRIAASVLSHARQMVCLNKQSSAFRRLRRQTEIRTAQVVVLLVLVYLTAWTPYAVVTFIGQFTGIRLSPLATALPSCFAKTAVVLDPLVYGFSHPHFRASLKHYLANVLADRTLSHANGHKAATGAGAASNSNAYPSRGMTVYPSGPGLTSEHHFYVAGSGGGGGGGEHSKRRMLRTFRDMSKAEAPQSRSAGAFELHHGCAATVSVTLAPPEGRTWRTPSLLVVRDPSSCNP